jgi:hypothetical protein
VANRYWVGGTATWDGTALLKWSTTSGGIGGSAVPTTSDTVFFDANSGAGTVTIGAGVATCSTLTMTGFTGTLAFGSNSITIAGSSATIYTGATTFSVTGTPVINCTYSGSTGTRSINPTIVTEANSISFNISAGSDTVAFGNQSGIKNLNFTGFSGTFNGGSNTRTIYGNLTLVSGMSLTAGTATTTFAATSGTQTITSAALNLDFPITFSGTATYQLIDNLSVGTATIRNITLTGGTLDLNNKTLTNFGQLASSSTNTRSILFGTTGNYTNTCTSTANVVSMATATGFTYTGTPTVNLTGNAASGVTRTASFGSTAGGTETNSFNYNISAGSDSVSFSGTFKNINFTGFTGQLISGSRTIYGNLTLVSGMTVSTSTNTTTFAATSGTQTITSASQTLDFPVTIASTGATVQLVDALTLGSTRSLGLSSGTLDLNNKTATAGLFSSTNSNTRSILFGTTGNLTIVSNNATIFNMTTATGFTYTGTPTVNLTYSGSTGTRTITCGNTAGGSEATALDFNVSAGSDIVAIYIYLRNLNFTGFTGTCPINTRTLYGSLTLSSGMTIGGGASTLTFASTLIQQNITSATLSLDCPITFSGTQTYQLQDALTCSAGRTTTLTSGTLDLNNKSYTTGAFSLSNSNTRVIAFGTTGNINLSSLAGTLWTTSTITGFSVTGTPTINATDSSSGNNRTFTQGGTLSNQAVSIYVKAGSGSVTFSGTNAAFQTIDLTGFSGTFGFTGSSMFVLGDFVLPSGTTYTSTGNTLQFVGTTATQKITTNNTLIDGPIFMGRALTTTAATGDGTTATLTFTSTGYYPVVGQTITVSGISPLGYNGTYTVTASSSTTVSYLNSTTAAQTTAGTVNLATSIQLQDAFTMGSTRQLSHASGTLDLNNKNLTAGYYNATFNAPHTVLFGTANITVSANNVTVWSNNSSTLYPFTFTGTGLINCTYSGSVGTRIITSQVNSPTETNTLNFNISAGSDTFNVSGNRFYNNVDFTGFTGAITTTSSGNPAYFYGNLTFPSSSTGASYTPNIYGIAFCNVSSSSTQTFTSGGLTIDAPVSRGVASTQQGVLVLADDLTLIASTSNGTFNFVAGTLNSNSKNITCAVFNGTGTNTKTLTITNSTITVTGGSTSSGFFVAGSGTTFNIVGSSIIFTTTGPTQFYGGGAGQSWPQVTISGVGQQLIIGASAASTSIVTLTNTVSPCTISILSTANTTTVTNFNVNGTAGNLVTLNSTTTGTAKNIAKGSGTVNAYYLAIQDSTATGGATWRAISSVNNGNNTGWFFDYTETVTENSSLADTPSTTAAFANNIAENSSLADTPTSNAAFLSNITEPYTINDSEDVLATFAYAVSEAVTLADLEFVVTAFASAISENYTINDTPSTTASFLSNISEPLTLADTPVGNATFAGVITEDTTLADIESVVTSFASAITESATLADSSIVLRTAFGDISEAITLADSQTVIANFASIVLENIGVAESESVVASFTAVISENANLADVESVLASFVSSLTEALTAADSSVAIKIFNSAITEDIQPADIQTALRTQYALISENLVPADAITVIASFTSQITENLVLLDIPFPRGWFKINDDQTVSWGAVNNTNSASWVAVNNGQTVTWNNVNNANSTTWTNIGDDQNPVWTNIDNTQ